METGGLQIVGLQPGTIMDWNSMNPQCQVCVGDRLVEALHYFLKRTHARSNLPPTQPAQTLQK
eukprot:171716-Amphidinium_carterae.1